MRKCVMIIDDDEQIVGLLKLSLLERGYDVTTACSATDATQKLEYISVDLIITDIFMDDGDGFDVIFKWRKQGKPCKLIAMSGGGANHGPETFLETARLAGAQRTFNKPFQRCDLLKAVDQLLEVDRTVPKPNIEPLMTAPESK